MRRRFFGKTAHKVKGLYSKVPKRGNPSKYSEVELSKATHSWVEYSLLMACKGRNPCMYR